MSYIRNYVDVHVSSKNTSSKSMILNELFKPHQTSGYYVKWGTINAFIILGVFALLVITALAIVDFLKQKEIYQERLIKKGAIYLGITSLCIFFVLLGSYLGGFISISRAFTTFIAVLTFDSGVFAYLYNNWNSNQTARMESAVKMKLQLHSEANWRPNLYKLMSKNVLRYRDVLYFTSFFNIEKKPYIKASFDDVDLDVKIRYALGQMIDILGNDKDTGSGEGTDNDKTFNNILNSLYQKQDCKVYKDKNSEPFATKLLKVKDLNAPLNFYQIIIFKTCIALLLKKDWKDQKQRIKKLEKEKNEGGQGNQGDKEIK